MRWQTTTVRANGVNLVVRSLVDPPAAPAVLLHGLGVSGGVLQPFARRLLPGLGAVIPDLRGHGQSDAPPSGYAPADYAADIGELIASELEPPVTVIGHSLGALVGLSLASSRPALVRGLVLLDPPLDPERRNPEIEGVYRLRHAAPGELEAYLLDRNPGGGPLLADMLAGEFRRAADAAFEAMLTSPKLEAVAVEAPVLVVQADPERGGVLGDDAAARAVQVLGNARLVKISGASHAVHATHPAQAAEAIREFYSSGAASSR